MERKKRNKVTVEFTDDEMAVIKAISAKEDRTPSKQVRVWSLAYLSRVPRVQAPARKR